MKELFIDLKNVRLSKIREMDYLINLNDFQVEFLGNEEYKLHLTEKPEDRKFNFKNESIIKERIVKRYDQYTFKYKYSKRIQDFSNIIYFLENYCPHLYRYLNNNNIDTVNFSYDRLTTLYTNKSVMQETFFGKFINDVIEENSKLEILIMLVIIRAFYNGYVNCNLKLPQEHVYLYETTDYVFLNRTFNDIIDEMNNTQEFENLMENNPECFGLRVVPKNARKFLYLNEVKFLYKLRQIIKNEKENWRGNEDIDHILL